MFCLSKQELVTLASSVCGDYSQLVESGAIAGTLIHERKVQTFQEMV